MFSKHVMLAPSPSLLNPNNLQLNASYSLYPSNALFQDESLGGGSNGWIKQLRVLRAFRLFRLFSKMGQLKRIVTAVALSIIPTLQALVSRDEDGDSDFELQRQKHI